MPQGPRGLNLRPGKPSFRDLQSVDRRCDRAVRLRDAHHGDVADDAAAAGRARPAHAAAARQHPGHPGPGLVPAAMRSKYNIVIVLVYMAIATSALLYMGYKMVGNCSVFAHCQTLNIEFKDTAGLVKTNDVRMAGITAGQVHDIRLEGRVALAVVQVNQNYAPVYKD